MLTRAKKSGNPRGAADGGSERRRTPIYIRVADRSNQRCIELAPLAQLPELVPNQEASSTTQFSTTYPESVQSSLEELFPDLDFVLPKVLVSIALREGETLLQTPDATNWLEHFPAVAKCVYVEGVYRSDDSSTVLLLMLPVAVWDLLPGDLPYRSSPLCDLGIWSTIRLSKPMNESCEPSTNLEYLLRSSQVWGLCFGVVVGGFQVWL